MKGLLIKDYYCLKKEVTTFASVTLGVMVMSVMFVLSSKYGNMASAMNDIQLTEDISGDMLVSIMDTIIMLTACIPLALVGSVLECFREDERAGFSKIAFSMPVSKYQIVGSRYLTCIIFSGVCISASLFCSVVVSSVSESMHLIEMLSVTLTLFSIFLIYMSLVLGLSYLFGAKYLDLIQSVPFVGAVFGFVIKFAIVIEQSKDITAEFEKAQIFFQIKYPILLMIAGSCMVISYLISVRIVEVKGEKN